MQLARVRRFYAVRQNHRRRAAHAAHQLQGGELLVLRQGDDGQVGLHLVQIGQGAGKLRVEESECAAETLGTQHIVQCLGVGRLGL